MKLVSMKLDPAAAKKMAEPCATDPKDMPQYPWGLCLNLDDEALEKLGIDKLPAAGVAMQLVAKVTVQSVSSNQTVGDDERRSLSLQITDMGLAAEGKKKSATATLYGGDEE